MGRVLPRLPVGLIFSGAPHGAAEHARSAGADFASLEAAHLGVEAVECCRRAGLKVTTWTVNEPERMLEVLSMGVDGIVTDRPDFLAEMAKPREPRTRSAGRQGSVQPREQRRGIQEPNLRCGQLQGERQPGDPPADGRDRRSVLSSERETG